MTNPEPFTANGSRAKHLALILNRYEAKSLSGQRELSDREHAEFLYESGHAEVIIIKQGPAGALICDKGNISYIPAYETSRVNKIGSGDAFVAYFSREWMLNKNSPRCCELRLTCYRMLLRKWAFPSAEGLAAFSPSPIKLSGVY